MWIPEEMEESLLADFPHMLLSINYISFMQKLITFNPRQDLFFRIPVEFNPEAFFFFWNTQEEK